MAARGFKQEMPPPGGFGPIDWAKCIPKKRWSGYTQFGVFLGFTASSWAIYTHFEKFQRREALEMSESRIAVAPLLQAEKNRLMLIQLRKNRDEEEELMKDVPNWKTGTLYGEPVYYNVGDRFIMPSTEGYFTHCSYWDKYKAVHDKLFH